MNTINNLLSKAIIIATNAHEGQFDKGGNQYILHPLSVMLKMKDDKTRMIAILHDVIEDTDITYDNLLQEGFCNEIIEGIRAITRVKDESYMDFIKRCKQNKLSKIVKLADLENNMDISRIAEPSEKDFKRIEKYKKAVKELLS